MFLLPLVVGGLVNDIGGDIADVGIIQTSSKGGHRIFAIGNLSHHRGLLHATGKVGGEGILLEGLLGHDDVLATSMASGTVRIEDRLTIANIGSKDWGRHKGGRQGCGCKTVLEYLGGVRI